MYTIPQLKHHFCSFLNLFFMDCRCCRFNYSTQTRDQVVFISQGDADMCAEGKPDIVLHNNILLGRAAPIFKPPRMWQLQHRLIGITYKNLPTLLQNSKNIPIHTNHSSLQLKWTLEWNFYSFFTQYYEKIYISLAFLM